MDAKNSRYLSIDALRGVIMLLMALDHANYFVAQAHPLGEHWGGNFPVYQDALSFITRLVTHLSAPGFFFLMGVGMVLFVQARRQRGWSEWQVIGHFVLRGLVLIFLQFTIVNQAWKLGPERFPEIYIGVLFALGCAMIIASLTLKLKPWHWLAIAGVLFLGTEMLHPAPGQWGLNEPWGLLTVYSGGTWQIWSNYPVLPWLELVFFGMFVGSWLKDNPQKTAKHIFWLGIIFLLAYAVIRLGDGFGNIRPRAGDSWIDFLNVVKYPPSMAFSLLAMGANLILLSGINAVPDRASRWLKPLAIFGRVPLFFYVVHLYLYLAIGAVLTPQGTSIPKMYPYWLLGLAVLYPLCMFYGRLKKRYPSNFLLRYW
ncbi:MAG: DUF1624 domain-containing protein [Anaerolineales bacterium]|nr:DUF1624 domain-containing protein [Chloroflexota bacterium]MBL6981649.1 DUF1624 domain-containing protein [Anaerolineales bacterium]